ncbi:PilZ domain-containing protein [Spirochaetes bacterium]|uniref:PilZ domain-containing protein n=1 Tax=Candidatus Scatousia excrementipullorum TaxID=2840936 RepID=A0A9D9GXV2_9BACT|nr:PilZ domain-containing protein [Candidatus Scatousia excrementipullorum]
MRELVEKDQHVIMIPADFRNANKGIITDVTPEGFTLELEYEPDGILKHTYCEFYVETKNGTLFFESFPKNIEGKTLLIASPAKHKFLQRRQFRRVKYVHELDLTTDNENYKITTLDISAGGIKFKTHENINIEGLYDITLPLSENINVSCKYSPIRIEKGNDGIYTHSGRFVYDDNRNKMELIQYCTKRSIEIKNK